MEKVKRKRGGRRSRGKEENMRREERTRYDLGTFQTIPVNNCWNVAKPNYRQIEDEQCREVSSALQSSVVHMSG